MNVHAQESGREEAAVSNCSKHNSARLLLYWLLSHSGAHAATRGENTAQTHHLLSWTHHVYFLCTCWFFNGSLGLENSKLPTLPCLPWIKALLLTSETAELFSSSPISSGAGEDRAIGWAHRRQMTQILSCPALVAPALVSWGKLINIKETMGGVWLMETERTNRAREIGRNHSDERNTSSSSLRLRASSSPSAWWAGRAVPVRQH